MAVVEANISMSVDGYVTGPDLDRHPGLGAGGDALHAWVWTDDGRRLLKETFGATGAVVTSRQVYDATNGWASENGLYGMPVFVVTHRPQEPVTRGETAFTFVEGVEAAIRAAATVAQERMVHIMGGASIIQQALRAGLVDRLAVHVAPVLLGSGTPLFAQIAETCPVTLFPLEQHHTAEATHLTYRVEKLNQPAR
ncbi:dihydrofolate reductase family protein [Dactylosporangium sp. NPDC050588]|uniref:dihydrofolate reductase family protein n=1 Tax=Dactylosporangium sp. NPDC050588 TaxID=3157211 RepID=UPI0033DE7A2A